MPKTLGRYAYRSVFLLTGLVVVSACASTSTYDNSSASLVQDTGLNTTYYGLGVPAPVGVLPSTDKKPDKKIYLGKASYICTPSGFGQKSSCVPRYAKT
ncbi:MAG: hypothetical protein OEL78_00040 [Hyphomicrobiales bacterium]|nr:hypothetical protein [Hyphomicrobiales bacterium]